MCIHEVMSALLRHTLTMLSRASSWMLNGPLMFRAVLMHCAMYFTVRTVCTYSF